ncbi:MAG: tRNA (adenosine(37)-N6)-threonylcarbamoyltransferase complex ATPase subunit type 1 TsaE [Candidatus Vogelbacteria bacterium]|nr:tRNA (adenosine(37)-N6)-threonylcarbamoyltransferase complex ATPase subunit type 1 TsaE [Candidatus Vogelbacteria bacterium]
MEYVSRNLAETAILAKEVLVALVTKKSGATVLALYGDLGSGKTTFTQFLAQALGITDYVTSPTFVLEKKYRVSPPFQGGVAGGRGGYKTLIHLDCYRLSGPADLTVLGWSEIVADPKNLIVIEWPERVESALPADTIKIKFEYLDENSRRVMMF